MARPRGARAWHLSRHRAYSRLSSKLGLSQQQHDVYQKLAEMHLREARRIKERQDG